LRGAPNTSLEETAPAAFTSARCARPRFGLRVLLLSSKPLGCLRESETAGSRLP
jgi:hypothetical protein